VSALTITALSVGAALFTLAIVAAFRSYEVAADRVTEATRVRLRATHPNGAHQSGPHSYRENA
jgi:hypothetical protein